MAGQLENYPYIPIAYPDDVAKAQPGRLNLFFSIPDDIYYGKDHYGKLHPIGSSGGVESALVTITDDGSSTSVNGAPFDTLLRFQLLSATAWNINDTITNNTTGATGIIIAITGNPAAPRFTLNTLTVGSWNIGDQVTNGSIVRNMGQNAIWIITVPTTKKAKLIFINSQDQNDTGTYSFGKDFFINRDCILVSNLIPSSDLNSSIKVATDLNVGPGWRGAAGGTVTTTSFTLVLNYIASGNIGLGMNMQIHIITE